MKLMNFYWKLKIIKFIRLKISHRILVTSVMS